MNPKQQSRSKFSGVRIVLAILALLTMAIGGVLIAIGMGVLSNGTLFEDNTHISEAGAVLVVIGTTVMGWTILRRGTLQLKETGLGCATNRYADCVE